VAELPGWEVVGTPGHTPGHVSFFRPDDRVLISGDALVTVPMNDLVGLLRRRHSLSGPPWYTTYDAQAATESLARLDRLHPAVIAGGHGVPFTGPHTDERLHAFVSGAARRPVRRQLGSATNTGISRSVRRW
jgi:glyoxylase-like metal-dependent hydrolase (beta-lactamase superfamily II)